MVQLLQLVQLVQLVLQIGQLADKTMQGRMGMALLPGSTRVLDRRTNTMVTCTKATCPLAQGHTTEVPYAVRPLDVRVSGLDEMQPGVLW